MQASTNIRRTSGRRAGRSRLLAVFAALLVSLFVLLEAGEPTQAIVGGTKAEPGKYPFMVALVYKWSAGQDVRPSFFCGGTLIDKDSVLTAAHCIRGFTLADVPNISAIVGTNTLGPGDPSGVGQADKVWIHGRFNLDPNSKDMKYDAAVINLRNPVLDPDLPIKPIRLATPNQDYLEKPGRKATVAGWGYTKNGGVFSRVLRQLRYPIRGGPLSSIYYPFEYRPSLMIAAGGLQLEGKGACKGDSGGPLFGEDNRGRYTQIGIASWVPRLGCGDRNQPDVYAEVNNPSIRRFITWAASQ